MMDLPCVRWHEHVAQKWAGLDPELQEQFTYLREIDDVFKYALGLTTQDDVDFVQSISAEHSVQKDSDEAAKCRERGNSSFKTRNYTEAALHYSQGICFAPQSSEQLSLCYANRSAALCHLQDYQECLDDIDRALRNGYPSHLLHKLQDRRTLCLERLFVKAKEDDHSPASKNHEGPGRVKAPSVGPLTFGICPQAVVGSSVEKGRHLVAVERIVAGQEILADRPYSCVLIPGMEEVKGKGGRQGTGREVFGTECRRCHRCLAETLNPVPCEGCSYSRYCSTGCQQEAWEEHHRWECPLGADLMVMGVMSQLALRVTLKAGLKDIQMAREPIRGEQKKSVLSLVHHDSSDSKQSHQPDSSVLYYGDSYMSVFHLLHHMNQHSPRLCFLYAVTAATLYLKLSGTGPPPASWSRSKPSAAGIQSEHEPDEEGGDADWSSEQLGSAVLRHILQLRCNAQAIVTLQDTGAANSPVQSSREIRIATAIFPTLSLLNHSCCPNTSLMFSTGTSADPCGSDVSADAGENVAEHKHEARGVTVTVRAAKVITPGQEILHCYGPHSSRMVTQERQRLLHDQYYFLCRCEACSVQQEDEEEGVEDGGQQWPGAGGGPQESGLLCCKCKGLLKRSGDKREIMFLCSRSSCGHGMSSSEVSRRLQEIRVDLEKAVELMERERPGDWKNAASHLECSAVAIGSQYGEDSIELGRQLFKLAQLHFNGGARASALSVIPKARRLLCLHCGPHCHELQELKAMEDCLRG
uniref:Protein-lysine N-methyltransferase SMYD4 n=1 Tax=Acanthochromis polyacanthus TaxID=80966 RepID=A0A3Q1GWQ8_9TELE